MINKFKYFEILQKYSKLEHLTCDFSNLKFEEQNYCISLSGGVDSMVLLDILYKLGKKIVAVHLNYNNRDETKLEEDFLREYCEVRNITFICHSFNFKRGSIKRYDYENLTKEMKFKLYKSILGEYNIQSILLAHHKDDIIENIFTNFCRGDNFLNLSVIKEQSTIKGVNVVRPLLNYYKDDIYNYAHYHEIPYFLDTTPDWSVRGKFRRNILPLLFNTFSGLKGNLLSIAKESDEWGTLIQEKFINKYYSHIKFYEDCVEMPIVTECEGCKEDYSSFPMCFWHNIFSKVFHQYGISAPSRKSLEIFYENINNKENKDNKNKGDIKSLLKHGVVLTLTQNIIKIKNLI